ncbi:GPP34 family phosphoprotein [Streptomyces sp. NPDC058290]|uniref:GPP34 family phosphoprotein n=1 Tax=Streptomyces sp. NPDC058290 TaxID=3346426 RepID=UPI0036E19B02
MTGTPLLFALCAAAHGRYPPPHREAETGRGLAGALLIQGALAGRLQLDDNRVRSTGHGRTDDPVLEEALDRLGPSARGRAPADWVERLGPWALTRLHPGPTLPPGGVGTRPDPADPRSREALRRVREAVQGPADAGVAAVAAGALLAAAGLHAVAWPEWSAAEASRRTARAVARLGPAGAPVVRAAAAAVSDSRRAAAAALAFPG